MLHLVFERAEFMAGVLTGLSIRWVLDRSKRSFSFQFGNRAGRDIAGGNITKRTTPPPEDSP